MIFRSAFTFFKDIYFLRKTIFVLAKREMARQYTGALLGPVWIYLQPLLYTIIIYFVFTVGLKVSPVSADIPHAVWLMTGLAPWFFFSSMLAESPSMVKEYGFLVKKVNFRLSVLPLVKLLCNTVPHLVFVALALGLAWYQGVDLGIHSLQLLYYFMAMCVLAVGLAWLLSSTNLFTPDVQKLTQLVVQFGFWLTPIFWSKDRIPERYHWLVDLNPMTYIVEGYRDSLLGHSGIWDGLDEGLLFWSISLGFIFLGALAFTRLRPHFAEVI